MMFRNYSLMLWLPHYPGLSMKEFAGDSMGELMLEDLAEQPTVLSSVLQQQNLNASLIPNGHAVLEDA